MRALVFTSLFPSPGWPTQWVYHVNVVTALAEFCDVRVVAPVWWQRRLQYARTLGAKTRSAVGAVPVYHPTAFAVPGLHGAHAQAMYRSVRGQVRRLHAEWPFDVILGIWAYPDTQVAGMLARDFHCPLVANVIGSDVNEAPSRPGMRSRVKGALESAHTVLALSRALRQRVEEIGIDPQRILVQYNGVDGERFRPGDKAEKRARVGYRGAGPLICYVGNLLPEKGPDVLLSGFQLLVERLPDRPVDLVVLGDGPMLPDLRRVVRAHGLESRVSLLGRRPNDEVADWVAAADVICLPSWREGCPNVVLEALAAGRPVVASSVGGVPELLNGDNGLLVPPGRPDLLGAALADAVSREWSPERLRSTVPYLSWRSFGARLHGVLETAVLEGAVRGG